MATDLDLVADWVRQQHPVVQLGTPESEARAIFTALDHERLVAQALKWHGNAQIYAEQRDAQAPAADALIADANRRLNRVKRLLSAKRKTVSMADLREALFTEEPQRTETVQPAGGVL